MNAYCCHASDLSRICSDNRCACANMYRHYRLSLRRRAYNPPALCPRASADRCRQQLTQRRKTDSLLYVPQSNIVSDLDIYFGVRRLCRQNRHAQHHYCGKQYRQHPSLFHFHSPSLSRSIPAKRPYILQTVPEKSPESVCGCFCPSARQQNRFFSRFVKCDRDYCGSFSFSPSYSAKITYFSPVSFRDTLPLYPIKTIFLFPSALQ